MNAVQEHARPRRDMLELGGAGRSADRSAVRAAARVLVLAGLAAAVATVVALLVAGGRPVPAPAGLPDAGATTGWALRGVRLLTDLLGVLTVGSLLTAAVLARPRSGPARPRSADADAGRDRDEVLHDVSARALGTVAWWGTAWAAGILALLLLTISDMVGVPLRDLDPEVSVRLASSGPGRALAITALLATVVALAAPTPGVARPPAATARRARLLLLVALAALLPPGFTAHASSAPDHDLATTALIVHVVAAAVWVGGLAGLVVHARRSPLALAVAVPRFSTLATVGFAALAGSGLLAATARLGTDVSSWTSGYGALLLAKAVALAVLGAVGLGHRRRTMPALATGLDRSFLRLAAVELVVMGVAFGLAAALARTPPPAVPVSTRPLSTGPVSTGPAHGVGHATLPTSVDELSIAELATAWRPNALVLVVLGLCLAAYLTGVRRLAREGWAWPWARTAAFIGGLALALLALCSGVATYAPALVSVQIAQFLVLLLPVPALLVLGSPLTLWLRVRGLAGESRSSSPPALLGSRVARLLGAPLTGGLLVIALVLAVYRTPLIEASLRSFWVHLLVLVLALVSGLLLFWPLLGVDAAAASSPSRAHVRREPALGAVGVAVCLALLAVQLRYGDQLLAGSWFLELRWGWVDPLADQRLGGLISGGAALATLLVAIAAAARDRADPARHARLLALSRLDTPDFSR